MKKLLGIIILVALTGCAGKNIKHLKPEVFMQKADRLSGSRNWHTYIVNSENRIYLEDWDKITSGNSMGPDNKPLITTFWTELGQVPEEFVLKLGLVDRFTKNVKYYLLPKKNYYVCYDQDLNMLWKIELLPGEQANSFYQEGVLVLIAGDIYRLVGIKSGKIIQEKVLSDGETNIRMIVDTKILKDCENEKVKLKDIDILPEINPVNPFILTDKYIGYFYNNPGRPWGSLAWKRPRDFNCFAPFLGDFVFLGRGKKVDFVDLKTWEVLEVIHVEKNIRQIIVDKGMGLLVFEDNSKEAFSCIGLQEKFGHCEFKGPPAKQAGESRESSGGKP